MFICVHTFHPSARLCPLTYISSLAFVICSSLVAKAPWMMSIIPFHIMWRHLSWQSSHCWGHWLMSLSKLTIDFKRAQVSVTANLYNTDYKLRIFHYQYFSKFEMKLDRFSFVVSICCEVAIVLVCLVVLNDSNWILNYVFVNLHIHVKILA